MWTRRREEKDDAYYDELIKQRIGEAIRSHMDDEKLDRAVLDAWIEEDNRKRAARRKRYMAVAACVLVLCIGTFGIKMILETEDTVAVAGKGDDVVNESGNNVVIKNNREDVEENIGGEEIVVKNWAGIKEIQNEHPELLIPGYIPKNYDFEKLTIESNSSTKKFVYTFLCGSDSIEIKQIIGDNATVFYEYDRKIDINENEQLLIRDDGKLKYAYYASDGFFIYLNVTNCEDSDLINIINGLKEM